MLQAKEQEHMKIWPKLRSNLKLYWIPAVTLRIIDLLSCHLRLIFAAYVVMVLQDIYYFRISSLRKTLISVTSPLRLCSN